MLPRKKTFKYSQYAWNRHGDWAPHVNSSCIFVSGEGSSSWRVAGVSVASQTCFSCLCPNTSRRQLKTSLESLTVSTDGIKDWSSSLACKNEGKRVADQKKKESVSHKKPTKSGLKQLNILFKVICLTLWCTLCTRFWSNSRSFERKSKQRI